MSLQSNAINGNVTFASEFPVDKIVSVFQGVINVATQMQPIGGLGSPNSFKIPHGYTRPVYTQIVSSPDNATFFDGGDYTIAYSDNTYVYILANQTTGSIYYRLICSWIDNFDTSNPIVNVSLNYNTNVLFDSRTNYQKIALQGSVFMAQNTSVSIPHHLGNTPNAKVFFEAFVGQIWPANSGGTGNPWLYDFTNQAELYFTTDSANLNIFLNGGNSSRNVYYRVFYDGS